MKNILLSEGDTSVPLSHPSDNLTASASAIDTATPALLSRRAMLARLAAFGCALVAAPKVALAEEDARKSERPPGNTNWKVIHEIDDALMDRIELGAPVALLIGTDDCTPCKVTAKWWSTKSMGKFEPYYLVLRTNEEWEKMHKRKLMYGRKPKIVPLMLMIHRTDREKQEYRDQLVVTFAEGYDQCTRDIAIWLNEKRQ